MISNREYVLFFPFFNNSLYRSLTAQLEAEKLNGKQSQRIIEGKSLVTGYQ